MSFPARLTALAAILLAVLATAVTTSAVGQTQPEVASPVAAQAAPSALAGVRSWGYQLSSLDVDAIARSPYDVVVIDYAKDGSADTALSPAELARLKQKPDGSRRLVLCYLSIGEAEEYRYYWKWHWGILWGWLAPGWRARHNAEWAGNYAVRYWQPGWQEIIVGSGNSAKAGYLDRILAQGFDGVYLDKIDSSLERVSRENPNARADMVAFVRRIAEKGRAAKPGFLVVPQNGEELLTIPGYRALIDGLGKEDLLYGEFTSGKPNPPAVIERRAALLGMLTAEGKPVLAVEYLDNAAEIAGARESLAKLGLIPHFADRDLDVMRMADVPAASAKSNKKRR